MRVLPVARDAIVRLVATTLAPIVPLALTMMPLEELLRRRPKLIESRGARFISVSTPRMGSQMEQ